MIAHPNIIKDLGRLLFWYPVRWVVQILPLNLISLAGDLFGYFDFVISGQKRVRGMGVNISRALGPQADAAMIVKKNLQNHCRNVLEFIKYPQINQENLARHVSFQNQEILDHELQKGKGVIVLTAHFGAKQMLQIGLGHAGYNVNQLMYHMAENELTYIQKNVSQANRIRIEKRIPAHFIQSSGFQRKVYTCLQNNEILIIAGDGSGIKNQIDASHQPFNFLGHKMLFPTGPVSLAIRTGAAIVPAFVVRQGNRHRVIFEPALRVDMDTKADTVQAYADLLEKYVRQFPHLWEFWEEFCVGHLLQDASSL